jgi:hypothetical protein
MGDAATVKPERVKPEPLTLQQPERLDFDNLQWTPGLRGVFTALIPADRVDEFVEGEGLRCSTKFKVLKTRGCDKYKSSDKVQRRAAPNTPQQIPTGLAIISCAAR